MMSRPPNHCIWPSLLAALLAQAAVGDTAHAQTVLDTAQVFRGVEQLRSREAAPRGIEAIPVRKDADRTTLRHLPATAQGFQIDGETGTRQWRVFMTAEDAAATRAFRVAYSAAGSVSPEASTLALQINGVAIGRVGYASPGDRKPVTFDIPPRLLRRGFNTVSLSVEQRHRVDCSTDATYELWTRFDPAQTSFVGAPGRAVTTVADLTALRVRADGALIIRVVFEGRLRPQRIDQIILAAQTIALATRSERTLVTFAPDPDADVGIDLMVGTAAETGSAASGASVTIDSSRAVSRLVLTGATDDDVAIAVAQLIEVTDAAKLAPFAPAMAGGERIRLADIAPTGSEFSGRSYRVPFDLRMPADFLAADYARLSFNLVGWHAAGLLAGAQLQLSVNGADAASVPLSNPAGGAFRHNDVVVPLSLLKPGSNAIEIAATLPLRNDAACDTADRPDAAPRFKLSGESEIHLPRLARIAQSPQLAQTAAGGHPYALPGAKPALYVPAPDRDSLSASVTLAVRLAVAAGRPIPFTTIATNPPALSRDGLVVAPARALDPAAMRSIGLDPDQVRRGWENRDAAAAKRTPPPPVADNLDPTTLHWAALSLRGAIDAVREQLPGAPVQPTPDLASDTALIVAQGRGTADDSGVMTIVTAPDAATLSRSVAALVDPARWVGLRGRLTVMNAAAEVLSSIEPESVRLVPTQPPSFGNARLIVAGWMSLHPAAYVVSALLAALLLALSTRSLVKNVGRRNS